MAGRKAMQRNKICVSVILMSSQQFSVAAPHAKNKPKLIGTNGKYVIVNGWPSTSGGRLNYSHKDNVQQQTEKHVHLHLIETWLVQ